MEVKEWSEKGEIVSVLGTNVFVIDKGKSENTLVILHGYATSTIDYHLVLPELSKHYRVILQDLVGFGFSDKPTEYHFNVLEQADVVLELWKKFELKNITLLSHNMGTPIALEILTRQRTTIKNIGITNLIFLNSTISFNYKNTSKESKSALQKFSKRIQMMFTSYAFFKMKMRDFFYDRDALLDQEIEARWTLINHKGGREIIDFLANYSTESKLLWNRWFTTIQENTLLCKVISGKNDFIFSEIEAVCFTKEFNNSKLHFIDNCGHYPMLEKPKELIEYILKT